MALTVGELAATITVDDSEAEQGLDTFQSRLRSALSRITQRAREGGQDAGDALGEGIEEGASEGAEAAGSSITDNLKGLALGAIGGSLGAALMSGIGAALEQEQITAKLGAQLGATGPEAERYGHIAGELYANAITEDIQGAADAIKATMNAGLLPPDATNDQIESISTKLSDLSTVLEMDVGDAANAAGAMVRNGLAKNAEEALDMLTQASNQGANRFGDLGDTITQSANNLHHFGLTGEEALGTVLQGLDAGAPSAETLTGALEEMAANASSSADVFTSLGLNGKQMAKDFAEGGPAAGKALDDLMDKLRQTRDPAKRSAAMVALFGEEALTMQDALLAVDPSQASARLGDFSGAADTAGDSLHDNAATKVEQFKRSLSTTFIDMLGNQVLPRLEGFFEFARENSGLLIGLAAGVTAVGSAFSLAAIGVWAMNSAMLANPIFWIVAGAVAAVAGAVILIVLYWDEIKAATLLAWDWVVGKITEAKDGIMVAVGFLGQIPGLVGDWFGDMKDQAVRKSTDLVTWLRGLPGSIGSAIGGMGSTLRGAATRSFQSFRDASVQKVASFITWVRGIPGQISRGIGSLSGLLSGKGQDVVRGLWNGIKSMGSWLRDTLIGWARSIIPGPIAKALGIASPSRVMRDQIGRWIPAGIVEGIEDGSGAVGTTMRNLVSVPTTGQATAAHVAAQSGGAVSGSTRASDVVRIGSDGSAFGDFIMGELRKAVGTRGGNVQFAITGRSA
ncbi:MULTISPECIES: phage tail tape measure protein [Streptomyces]|uniref:Phage tail tape measure protein n=1 Tax=Streptomyces dengpaensis TaxID=2049881 RepID=A0ABN5I5N6_9ACTN|nr:MULTISPECIES: phage tail tape measure protein [Streptomyces]AVH58377.1 phage tail tape measure protein [Streptomyces dengpaensis]PIB06052.1 phage tail tape measure protein [Streptomyces sp. HG99]